MVVGYSLPSADRRENAIVAMATSRGRVWVSGGKKRERERESGESVNDH
jgi:hypothetical protein